MNESEPGVNENECGVNENERDGRSGSLVLARVYIIRCRLPCGQKTAPTDFTDDTD